MRRKGIDRRAVAAIARKDIRAITSNVQVWLPMAIVPTIFCLVLPVILGIAIRTGGIDDGSDIGPMLALIERMPHSSLKQALDSLEDLNQRMVYLMFNHLFAPLFLIVPIMAASTVATDSFVGEKERGTFESLLLAPIDLMSMVMGKVMAAFIPAVTLSLASFVVYGIAANIAGWSVIGRPFFPHVNWLPLMALVMPAVALLAVAITGLISARTSSFQAAYQMSARLVIPLVMLMIGQVTGVMLLDTASFTLIGIIIAIVDWILIRLIVSRLDRSRMFESQVK